METIDECFKYAVAGSGCGDGIIMSLENSSRHELVVRFPNPYTGIRLYTKSGQLVPMGRSILCWEENDPVVVLRPGRLALAVASLKAFWFDVCGEFLVKCSLGVSPGTGESKVAIVEGHVNIELGPY